jgi:hypothetical protein
VASDTAIVWESARPGGGSQAPGPGELTIEQILAWADAFRAAHRRWPDVRVDADSGTVEGAPGETWQEIDWALKMGKRGLPRGLSLAWLLARQRGASRPKIRFKQPAEDLWAHAPPHRNRARVASLRLPRLTIDQIVSWARKHRKATGASPNRTSGNILGAPGETWASIDGWLRTGGRGLRGGSSLRRLLEREGLSSKSQRRVRLTLDEILRWADAHRAATGKWPGQKSGAVRTGPEGLTWCAVEWALCHGRRGLPPGSSLAGVIREFRTTLPPVLDGALVLAWATAHHAATGRWPRTRSGQIPGADGLYWSTIDYYLRKGKRGFSGGDSLSGLLEREFGVPRNTSRKPLDLEQILAWADAHHAARGKWPHSGSGPIEGAPGESWMRVHAALYQGGRGLPGGSSLSRLLVDRRGSAARRRPPRLTAAQVLAWSDVHHAAHGRWPTRYSGTVSEASDERWSAIDRALHKGHRGLPRAGSLACFLAEHRGRRNQKRLPPLTLDQVRAWADAHRATTGRWPRANSGQVTTAPGENWMSIDYALRAGARGLPGGRTLCRLQFEQGPTSK